jgi:hypothetical protein
VMLRRLRQLIRGQDGTGLPAAGGGLSKKCQEAVETGRPGGPWARQMH